MKRVLYVIRRNPGVPADETLHLVFLSRAFDQGVSVLFMDDGVHQLLDGSRQASARALSTYDIDAVHVSTDSLASRAIDPADLAVAAQPLTGKEIQDLIASHDVVLSD